MNDEQEECGICGLELRDKYSYKLNCNHEFHYECLIKSFQNIPKLKKEVNHCPYCREKSDYLPLINGLKRIIPGVHCNIYDGTIEAHQSLKKDYSVPCQHILTRGKNKGSMCQKNCFLGYNYCKIHKKDINLITDSESVTQSTNTEQQLSLDGESPSDV